METFDRALTWTEVVSGMLRMQVLTDFLRLLQRKEIVDEETYVAVHQNGNMAIDGGSVRPFEDVLELLEQKGGDSLKAFLDRAIANSSALAYLNLGRPETILLDPMDRMGRR